MSRFITFEGPEGSGKSTLCARITDYLVGLGYDAIHTREPGGTEIGQKIRALLLNPNHMDMGAKTEFLLFSAARAQHVEEKIRPHLERGGVVVCDRFADSSFAYQGAGHGLDVETLRLITAFATGGLRPDLTVLFDLEVEQGLARRRVGNEEWNRLDGAELAFHRRARRRFRELAQAEPERWITIDASRALEEVEGELRAVLTERIPAPIVTTQPPD